MQVSGAGIILWDDLWKACSRLLSGSSLEMVVASRDDDAMQVDAGGAVGPPLLITQFGEGGGGASEGAPSARQPQSDEELARRLAAEWGSMPEAAAASAPGDAAKSDEDYARELQAQLDAEMGGAAGGMDVADVSSQAATTEDVATLSSDRPPTPLLDTNKDAVMEDATAKLDFEKHGVSFSLYHYNGLSKRGHPGGTLTPFRVTRLSPTEAVGASIALSSKGSSGHGAGGGDLEDVVRTKWPSSMLNWLGKSPPSID